MNKHDLRNEFSEYSDLIHELKMNNPNFKKIFDEYNKINKEIHKFESNEIFSDPELNVLRLKRVHLKDQIYSLLLENHDNI